MGKLRHRMETNHQLILFGHEIFHFKKPRKGLFELLFGGVW